MSNSIDQKMVEAACMADLSRHRQEELPLSDVSKRPSFLPGYVKTDHIPKELKLKLGSKWSVKIQDEESEQMEGLTIEEDRPWAKFANQYMNTHRTESAPPLFTPGPQKPRIQGQTTSQQLRPVQSSAPVPTHISAQITSKPQQASSGIDSAKVVTPQSSNALTSTSQDTAECVLCRGQCQVVSGIGKTNNSFAAEFAMKLHLKTNEASLVLTALGKGERVHNVLDLEEPVVEGLICVVSCPKRDFMYRLGFQKSSETESFRHYLHSLQQSAIQHRNLISAPAPAEPTPAAASPTAPVPTPAKVQKTEEKVPTATKSAPAPVSVGSGDISVAKTAKDESVVPAEKPNEELVTTQPEKRLIDIEDASPMKEVIEGKRLAIDDAADRLQGLVQNILSNIVASGIELSQQAVDEVEDATIENWIGQGFLGSESDDMKEELTQLLRVLVRIKRKAEFRRRAKAVSCLSPTIEELKGVQEAPEKKTARIQYTSEEIQRLEVKAAPRQTEVQASTLHQKSPVQSAISVKEQISAVSKHKAWLTGKSDVTKQAQDIPATVSRQDGSSIHLGSSETKPKVVLPGANNKENLSIISKQDRSFIFSDKTETQPTVALSAAKPQIQPFQGLASSRWANQATRTGLSVPVAKPADTSRPMVTSRTPTSDPKGLSSSRWADKPVAFAGHFAGH